MMPSINAATPPVDKFNAMPGSAQRSANKDQSSDNNSFHNILRKSSEDHQNDTSPAGPVKKPATTKADDGTSSNETDTRGIKKVKSDKDEPQTAVAAGQPIIVAQPNPAPLQALLNLLSVQQPVQNTPAEKTSTVTNPVTSIVPAAEDAPPVTTPALQSDAMPETAAVSKPDVNNLTVKDKRGGAQSVALPLSFDPILLAGANWSKEASLATAASGNGSGVASATANALQTPKSDALVLATQQNPEAMAPALSPKTLAFAMRLGSVTQQPPDAAKNVESAPPSVKALLDTSGLSVIGKAANDGGKQNAGDSSGDGGGSMFGAAFADTGASARTSSDKVSFTEAAHSVASAPGDEVTASTNNSDPLRNILLQLKSDDNRRVDVRLVDRDGELHVSVKSADPALAQQVQEHMPELTSRLSDQQFTHDVWMPKLSEVVKTEGANNNGNSFNNNNSSQSGQSNGGNAGRQQSSNGQSRPDWVDLLENQLS